MSAESFNEVSFDLGGIVIAAKEWGNPDGIPVLALHGWLDNCASFNRLAPLLENIHLVALDCAGHGMSGHRPAGMGYPILQDVVDVFDVADQLGWQEFGLLGHSRGAIISTLTAGTFPNRITHLGLIDGFLPGTTPASDGPKQLAQSIIESKRNRTRGFAVYPDIETAIHIRQQGQIPISYEGAKQLVDHGLAEVEGGYTWRNDPQLKGASSFRLTSEHSDAFVQRISAPIQLVLAENGIARLRDNLESAIQRYPQVSVTRLSGSHHLHMEDQAGEVAKVMNFFFAH